MKMYLIRYQQDDTHHTPSQKQGELWVPEKSTVPGGVHEKEVTLQAFYELVGDNVFAEVVDESPDDPAKDMKDIAEDMLVVLDGFMRRIRQLFETR